MIKKSLIICLTTLLILLSQSISAKELTREEYIKKFHNIAIRNMKYYGIPASITLAQACLESGNGNSRLAARGHNHFGIKCGNNWRGAKIRKTDDARRECFRRYFTDEQSFKDHAKFLRDGSRYNSLFSLDQTDYKAWAHGLKAAGYATNPKYATQLIEIIEKHQLYMYDSEKRKYSKREYSKVERAEPVAVSNLDEKALQPLKNSPFYRVSPNRELYTINGVTLIIASFTDSYKKLAKEYNLFTKEILSFNNLTKESSIKDGTIIYIEKKKRSNKEGSYRVKEGDTLYKISQEFGIQLRYLYKYNRLRGNSIISIGQVIKLKE